MVGMAIFGKMLCELVFSPCVVLQVFGVLRVDCVQLSFGGGVQHEWVDEETREAVKGIVEGPMRNLEEEVGLLEGRVGIGGACIFAEKLTKNRLTLEYSFSAGYLPVPMKSICSR